MLDKNTILKDLYSENYYIDKNSLDDFIKEWKIDPVFEDENKIDFYDDLSVLRIKKGINLKAQGYNNEQIIQKISKIEQKALEVPEVQEENTITYTPKTPELRNITLDVTSQTLHMLAEAVAKKISEDIKNSDMTKSLIEAGGYKRDNEILAKQVQELLEHNKELTTRIEQLESHSSKRFWKRFWGQ